MRLFAHIHKLLSALICKAVRNFWHGETSAENALILVVDGRMRITMRKSLVDRDKRQRRSARFISFSHLSSFMPTSKETLSVLSARSRQRRCSPSRRVGRFASDDASYAIARRDWPCANLTYITHSKYSSLLSNPPKRTREEARWECDKEKKQEEEEEETLRNARIIYM